MVKLIRHNEELISNSNLKNIQNSKLIQRSIICNKDLDAGTKITKNHLAWVRPGTGINPGNENMILGKILNTNIKKGEQFKRKFLKK